MMRKVIYLFVIVFAFSCNQETNKKAQFAFIENDETINLVENEQAVFSYQKALIHIPENENPALKKDVAFNHYIHPLYSLSGDTITEAQPKDNPWHLHHRGIFWVWHQLYIGDESVGDSWVMENFRFDILGIDTEIENEFAQLKLHINWVTTKDEISKAFVEERTTITVYPSTPEKRIIDFEIKLKALVPNVSIGGSEDEKGYSGFSTRIKMPDDLSFRSNEGEVNPILFQVQTGPWLDFSVLDSISGIREGMTILSAQSSADGKIPWILRRKESMQNVVFPGRERYTLPADKYLTLKYRLVIHQGENTTIENINNWYDEYKKQIAVE